MRTCVPSVVAPLAFFFLLCNSFIKVLQKTYKQKLIKNRNNKRKREGERKANVQKRKNQKEKNRVFAITKLSLSLWLQNTLHFFLLFIFFWIIKTTHHKCIVFFHAKVYKGFQLTINVDIFFSLIKTVNLVSKFHHYDY